MKLAILSPTNSLANWEPWKVAVVTLAPATTVFATALMVFCVKFAGSMTIKAWLFCGLIENKNIINTTTIEQFIYL